MSDAFPNLRLEPNDEPPTPAPRASRVWWLVGLIAIAILFAVVDVIVLTRRNRYLDEITRLRESMSLLERERADQIVAQEANKLRLALALLKRQAKVEKSLHLSVSVDSSAMYLERDGALLREMPVMVGPERRVGLVPDTVRLAPPLGVRRVAQVMSDSAAWLVPAWVYVDRGLQVPSDRAVPGGLGPAAILLDGGAIIYSLPTTGPLSDSSYVLPGAIRARAEDLRAVVANLTPGMRIYFY